MNNQLNNKNGIRQIVIKTLQGNDDLMRIGDDLKNFMEINNIPFDFNQAKQIVALRIINNELLKQGHATHSYDKNSNYSNLITSIIQTNQIIHLMTFYQMFTCCSTEQLSNIMTTNEIIESLIGR